MHRFLFLLPFFLLLTACQRTYVSSSGCTAHVIPGDPNVLHAGFHQTDEKYDYIVLTYGRKHTFETLGTSVVVDGKEVKVPHDGGVYVLDNARTSHKTTVAADDLQRLLWSGNATGLPDSKVWKDQLYQMLKKHAW